MPVGLAKDLKTCVRQRVRHDADLHADRLVGHEGCEMLGLGAGERAALAACRFRQVEAADQSVVQKALHFGGRDQVDDARCSAAEAFLALAQNHHDLSDLI